MVTILSDGWMIIREDEGNESIVRIDTICMISGDEDEFTICFVNGDEVTFTVKGGLDAVSRELTGHMVKPKIDSETFGRVPV